MSPLPFRPGELLRLKPGAPYPRTPVARVIRAVRPGEGTSVDALLVAWGYPDDRPFPESKVSPEWLAERYERDPDLALERWRDLLDDA